MGSKSGTVRFKTKTLPAKLLSLPTVTESYKCHDNVHLFKTADVRQVLVCGEPAEREVAGTELRHGITPPLKNVRRRRFRKTRRNGNLEPDEGEVEKEVLWLLRMDNEAVG